MKKLLLSLFVVLMVCSQSIGQRTARIVSPAYDNFFGMAVLNDRLYLSEYGSPALQQFHGTYFTSHTFPTVGGVGLTFSRSPETQDNRTLFTYHDKIYMKLSDGRQHLLYSFDGSRFSLVLESATISNLCIFQDRIYVMTRTLSGDKLVSYDGTTAREVTGHTFSAADSHLLQAAGDYLYIQSYPFDGDVVRYNGSFQTLTDLPHSTFGYFWASPGSEEAYVEWIDGSGQISFFNSSSSFTITGGPVGESGVYAPQLLRNHLYFLAVSYTTGHHLWYDCVDGHCSSSELPAGVTVDNGEPVIFRDALYQTFFVGGVEYLYGFDGTSFTRVGELPAPGPFYPAVVGGKLLIVPHEAEGNAGFEYDGTTITRINLPMATGGGHTRMGVGPRTSCFQTWPFYAADTTRRWRYNFLAIDQFDVACPTDDIPAIPRLLLEGRSVSLGVYARERDWCWTGVDVNWVDPICRVLPCAPDPATTTLTDAQGKIAWQKTFDNSFSAAFDLEDINPFTLSVALKNDKAFENVLVLDQNLVRKGIEAISFDVYPQNGYFNLTVDTDKQQEVPFSLTLRSTNGEALWKENFIAPLDQVIQATVSKPGDYLQLSLLEEPSGVSYYPNPFKGSLKIDVSPESIPATISLSDLNGKVITQKTINEPGQSPLEVGNQKPGLYLLSITEGKELRHELVQITE